MATKRLDMRRTKEILRMKWERGLSHRKIARSLGISAGVVGSTVSRAKHAGLSAQSLAELSEERLEHLLYGVPMALANRSSLPAPEHLEQELRRPGVTLELLHIEYLEEHPDGLRYTSFCNHYRKWKERQSPRMRQTHRAGEKLFVDYAGKRPRIVDRETGEAREVESFVAALGAVRQALPLGAASSLEGRGGGARNEVLGGGLSSWETGGLAQARPPFRGALHKS